MRVGRAAEGGEVCNYVDADKPSKSDIWEIIKGTFPMTKAEGFTAMVRKAIKGALQCNGSFQVEISAGKIAAARQVDATKTTS